MESRLTGKAAEIVILLRKNSRTKLTDISERCDLPLTTAYMKLANIEKMNIKYTTLVDFKDFGFFARNKMAIKVGQHERQALETYLMSAKNVNNMYVINNGFDFFIETVFPSKVDFRSFVEDIGSKFKISEMHIFEVVEDKKRESFEPV